MAKQTFQLGDKVRFKLGGPWMLVTAQESGKAICQWFTKNDEFQEAAFSPDFLEKADAPSDGGIFMAES